MQLHPWKNSKFVVAKSGETFDGSLRRVEVEVRVRLELGEWLTEIGQVLAGVVSIAESPLAHSNALANYADRPFKSLNSYCGLHSRNLVTRSNCHVR